jgi:hypothetical protein
MSVKIQHKHSSVLNKAPVPADLTDGELALNTNSGSPAAYIKDSAGNIVKIAGAGAVGATDATTAAKGVVQLADAAAITAGTAGRVVDAAQLKAEVAAADDWTRTGTTLAPATAGDVVTVSAGTAALPGLTPVGDPDTGIHSPGADTLALSTNGLERTRIDSSGRLLVGTNVARSVGTQSWAVQNEGTTFATIGFSTVRNSNDPYSSYLALGKSRGGAVGANTIVQNGDQLGTLLFAGANGVNLDAYAGSIACEVDGAPSASSMPGRLVFSTTSPGASTSTPRATIDSSGRLLLGTNVARSVATQSWAVQNEGTTFDTIGFSTVRNSNDSFSSYFALGKSRGGAVGANTIVQNGDQLGMLLFAGANGVSLDAYAGSIACEVDGVPSATSMPGRLVFGVTATGTTSPTERLRILNDGKVLVGASIAVAGSAAKLQCATTANLGAVAVYADNTAATAGGLVAGDIYRKADGTLMITF